MATIPRTILQTFQLRNIEGVGSVDWIPVQFLEPAPTAKYEMETKGQFDDDGRSDGRSPVLSETRVEMICDGCRRRGLAQRWSLSVFTMLDKSRAISMASLAPKEWSGTSSQYGAKRELDSGSSIRRPEPQTISAWSTESPT